MTEPDILAIPDQFLQQNTPKSRWRCKNCIPLHLSHAKYVSFKRKCSVTKICLYLPADWLHQKQLISESTFNNIKNGHITHTHPFNGPFSGTTRVSQYQKGKTNLDFTEARDSEWQWHQLDHMQVCTSLQADNHATTQPLSFLQARCPSCRPTNSVKALKAKCEIIWSNQVTQNIYTSLFVKFYICHIWSLAPNTKEFICSNETAKKGETSMP